MLTILRRAIRGYLNYGSYGFVETMGNRLLAIQETFVNKRTAKLQPRRDPGRQRILGRSSLGRQNGILFRTVENRREKSPREAGRAQVNNDSPREQ
jgi:hypothetical protein